MNAFRFVLLALAVAAPAPAAEPHAYRAARVWPGDGPVIADGVAVVIPGLVVAETSLAEKGRDDLHTLTPQHRAIDGFDPYADYSAALAGGVTTVQIAPGGKRLLPGQGAVVKL